MGKKKKFGSISKIGEDVLGKGRKLLPKEIELTAKLPSPLDMISLRVKWEKEKNRKLTDEEFKMMLQEYIKSRRIAPSSGKKVRTKSPRVPKQVRYV